MTDPRNEGQIPGGEPARGPEKNQPELQKPMEADVYSIAEPAPEPPGEQVAITAPVWYAAKPGGVKEGPLSLAEMRRRIASGRLRGEGLVWRSGMSGWTPAQDVAELFPAESPYRAPPPPPSGPPSRHPPQAGPAWPPRLAEAFQLLDDVFSSPTVYRVIGRAAALVGLLTLVVWMALLLGRSLTAFTWFAAFLLCALIFIVGETAAAVLQVLHRIEVRQAEQRQPQHAAVAENQGDASQQGGSHGQMPIV